MIAPVGGWNARDPLAAMSPDDAIVLDNIIPGTNGVSLRQGFDEHVTGLGDFIESLMEYSPPSGSNKLFAATPGSIFDVTAAGAVGAAVVSSLSNGRWGHTMFATSGGNFLVCANGADAVRNYNGAAWSTPTINNVTSANLIGVTAHVQRLWFVEKDKLDPWYLPVAAISGDASKLIIAPFCKLGGYLVAIGSWSRDGGAGPADLLVLLTSKGEVVIYSGFDPSDSTNFHQVGVYRIPEPIGRRCLYRAGSDLAVLTSVGLIPLSAVLVSATVAQEKQAITDKIRNAFAQSYGVGKDKFGWQVLEYPRARLIIVNIPVAERDTQYQYVASVDAGGAWCRFTGLNGGCWSLLGDNPYFGGNDGTVYKYGVDYLDVNTVIPVTIQQAFVDFGNRQQKQFKAARPIFIGPQNYTPAIEIKLNYDTSPVTLASPTAPSAGSVWDEATWDDASWSASSAPSAEWQIINGIGHIGSLAMAFSLSQEFTLNRVDIRYERGGPL